MDDQRRALIGAPAALASVLFLWIPLCVYAHNIYAVDFALASVLPFFLALVALSYLGLRVSIRFIPTAVPRRALLISLNLVAGILWVQYSVIGWSGGALDGSPVTWMLLADRMWVEGLLWIFILAVGIRYAAMIPDRAVWMASCFLSLVFASNTAFALLTVDVGRFVRENDFVVDQEKRFRFSSEGNIIVVIWDEFQANQALEILADNPELNARFQGFRFYKNVIGGYQSTTPSIPYLLSGKMYDNSGPYSEFLKRTFVEFSAPAALRRDGYLADLVHAYPNTIHMSPEVQDNLVSDTGRLSEDVRGFGKLLEMALFASSPHFAKGLFYTGGEWPVSRKLDSVADYIRALEIGEQQNLAIEFKGDGDQEDLGELQRLANEISIIDRQSIFKFFHFRGAHVPFNITRDGQHRESENTLADYREMLEYKLYLMTKLIEILQKSEIYDNSMIVFAGDHGSGRSDEALVFRHPQTGAGLPSNLGVKARATPFLAVKFPERRGAPQVFDSPVSLGDVNEMILSGGDDFVEGRSENWIRRYFQYQWHGETREYLDELTEFMVTDHAWLDEAWTPYHIHDQGIDPASCFFSFSQNRELIRRSTMEDTQVSAGNSLRVDAPASKRPLFAMIVLERMNGAVSADHQLQVTQGARTLFIGGVEQLLEYQESIGVQVAPDGGPLELAFDSGVQGSQIFIAEILWIAYDACLPSACGDNTRQLASRTSH